MKQCSLGHVNSDGTDFCTTCGQQLLAASAPRTPQTPPASPINPPMQAPVNPSANPWATPPPPVGGWQPHPYQQVAPSRSSNRGWIIGGIAIGVLVLLVGVFALTRGADETASRSTSNDSSNSDSNFTPPDNDTQDLYRSDADQLRDVLDSQGVFIPASDSNLEDLAQSICDALASGASETLIVQVGMESGLSRDESIALVAASIVVLCPWES